MIHIVFQQADVEVLEKAIVLDDSLQGNIVEIKDDYAVGPIAGIYEAEGFQARKQFWKDALEFSSYSDQLDIVDDKLTVHNLKKLLDENEEEFVWMWMGQNQHDVCGYYWLMSQLKDYQGRIHVLYLNNLPFINEKGGIFYPSSLYEIQPKEFLKAKRLSRPVTLSEFEIDPDEWKKLCTENAMVRILEGGKKIAGKEADFFDKELLSLVASDGTKLPRLISQALSKLKVKTGDVFLVWRIRQLIAEEKLSSTGDWTKGWKDIELKPAGVISEATAG